jgi:hypothetical protein
MGLRSDLQELADSWKNRSWSMKLVFGLSLFMTSASIASLSEAVFRWKGFILDALKFYREHISTPLHELFAFLPMRAPTDTADCFVLAVLLLTWSIRVGQCATDEERKGFFLVFIPTVLIFCLGDYIYSQMLRFFEPELFSIVFLLYLSAMLWTLLAHFEDAVKTRIAMPLVLPLYFVGILAAVNVGLERTV